MNGYPLPWCEAVDRPYWQINLYLCCRLPKWAARQSKLAMADIIPVIDRDLADGRLIITPRAREAMRQMGAV